MAYKGKRVVAIIPAFNEALSIADVVNDFLSLKDHHTGEAIFDQILVGDNGSNDGTAYLASDAGATVIREDQPGYGIACLACMNAVRHQQEPAPDFVIFADGDRSVLATESIALLNGLDTGQDLVIGARASHLQEPNSLSPHQRLGTRLACWLIRALWHTKVTDLGPFRGVAYPALLALDMQDQRFGWTVEMQVKALQLKLNYSEVPVTTRTRVGVSKISGTLSGTLGAARGIFGKIFTLYRNESNFINTAKQARALKSSNKIYE